MSRLIVFCGNGSIPQWMQSTDSGATWSTLTAASFPAGFSNANQNGFRVLDDNSWLLVGDDGNTGHCVAFRSTDQGVSWTAQGSTDVFGGNSVHALLFDDIQIAFRGSSTKLVVSTDKFVTKTNVTLPGGVGALTNPSIGTFTRVQSGRFATIWRDGANDDHAMYSDDGSSWFTTTLGYPGNGTGGVGDTAASLAAISNSVFGAMSTGVIQDSSGAGAYSTILANTHTGNWIMSQPVLPFFNTRLLALFGDGPTGPFYSSVFSGSSWGGLTLTNLAGFFPTSINPIGFYVTPDNTAFILIASNGAGQPTMLRSTDGITFATVTIPATSGGVSNFMATPDHAVAPAPAERPHFIDRGLPIEIAGPRNDITRRAYLPIVRIFGS